jgi:hypothetical protein
MLSMLSLRLCVIMKARITANANFQSFALEKKGNLLWCF